MSFCHPMVGVGGIEMIFVCESLRPCVRMSEILYAQLILDTSSDLLETLQVFLLLYKAVYVVFRFDHIRQIYSPSKITIPIQKACACDSS